MTLYPLHTGSLSLCRTITFISFTRCELTFETGQLFECLVFYKVRTECTVPSGTAMLGRCVE